MYKTLVLTQNSQPFPIALGQLELQCDFPGQTHTTLGQQGASLMFPLQMAHKPIILGALGETSSAHKAAPRWPPGS